jgi:hypothetical protein
VQGEGDSRAMLNGTAIEIEIVEEPRSRVTCYGRVGLLKRPTHRADPKCSRMLFATFLPSRSSPGLMIQSIERGLAAGHCRGQPQPRP